MPDKRTHRGKHPQDNDLFASEQLPGLRLAVRDLSWLLSRGYAVKSSLKLVGDRFALKERQRMAVMRCACSDEELHERSARQIDSAALQQQPLLVDGYNVITTIETALSGGVVLKARDGSYRDIAGVHGTYRKVEETIPSLELLGRTIAESNPSQCLWYLDRPVSNSGRLKTILMQLADENNRNWQVNIVANPDPILSDSHEIVATSDSIILNHCQRWFNLVGCLINDYIPDAFVVDLSSCMKGKEEDKKPLKRLRKACSIKSTPY